MLFTDVSTERAVRALKKVGFRVTRSGKHLVLTDGERLVTVPRHGRLNPYTLRNIIRDAGLTDQAFKELLA
ncbi:MAG: type II toxin-antitoxin system HicA family toxin [Acidobacteria bacterium]|nr:type II toxin-antitoxin system HicA family toxin [Acidobacteriota bacterium]